MEFAYKPHFHIDAHTTVYVANRASPRLMSSNTVTMTSAILIVVDLNKWFGYLLIKVLPGQPASGHPTR